MHDTGTDTSIVLVTSWQSISYSNGTVDDRIGESLLRSLHFNPSFVVSLAVLGFQFFVCVRVLLCAIINHAYQ